MLLDVLVELVDFAGVIDDPTATALQLLVKFVSLILLAADELVTGE